MGRSGYREVRSRQVSTGLVRSSSAEEFVTEQIRAIPSTPSFDSSDSNTLLANHQLFLNFSGNGHSSQTEKCRSFWRYLATRPDLEVLRRCGEVEVKKEIAPQLPSAPQPPRTSSQPWMHQLMKLQARGLPRIALDSLPPPTNANEPRVFAYAMEKYSPAEVMTEIEDFQNALDAREARRDPNQSMLGYRIEQPPPVRIHN